MATVVLADDHALVRAGLRRIIENNGNVVLGGDFNTWFGYRDPHAAMSTNASGGSGAML